MSGRGLSTGLKGSTFRANGKGKGTHNEHRSKALLEAAGYRLPMSEAKLETFPAHTGVRAPRPGGYSEAVAIVGRQSGKSQVAAMVAVFEAITATRAEARVTWAVLVAQDQRSALRTRGRREVSRPCRREQETHYLWAVLLPR